MRSLTCVLPIEISTRDLDPKLLLAVELAKRGFPVLLGGKGQVRSTAKEHAPYLYFDKGSAAGPGMYRDIVESGGKVVMLDDEGGIVENGMFTLLVRYPEEVLPFYSLVFCWGEKTRDCLLERKPLLGEVITAVVGHPKFDLSLPRYRPLYADGVAGLRAKYGDFVLINTSFAYANHFLSYEEGIRPLPGHFGLEDPLKDYVDEGYYRLIIYYFIRAIRRLARKFPETGFVLRPHPSENPEHYKRFLAEHGNVHVIYCGDVHEWILASKAVMHHDCTTGVESALAGVPTVSYVPIADNDFAPPLPMAISDNARNEEELLDLVASYLTRPAGAPEWQPRNAHVLSSWLANTRQSSSNAIATVISERCDELVGTVTKPRRRSLSTMAGQVLKKTVGIPAALKGARMRRYVKHKRANSFPEKLLDSRIRFFREVQNAPQVSWRSLRGGVILIEPGCSHAE